MGEGFYIIKQLGTLMRLLINPFVFKNLALDNYLVIAVNYGKLAIIYFYPAIIEIKQAIYLNQLRIYLSGLNKLGKPLF